MGRKAIIIGGGQIGFALHKVFRTANWDVSLFARSKPEWLEADQDFQRYETGQKLPFGADCLIDTIAFDAEDLVPYVDASNDLGRVIAISSASVYIDEQGRTLDEAMQKGFPRMPPLMTEEQPTVDAGPETYSTRKVRMELELAHRFGDRATVLRATAVHGPWSRHPREWWFVKRLLDARAKIPLAFGGQSRFHTCAASNLAALAHHLADKNIGGIFNACDPDRPTTLEIGQTVASAMRHEVEFILLEKLAAGPTIGRTPWSIPREITVSDAKARANGFVPTGDYSATVKPAIEWLCRQHADDWKALFAPLAAYPYDMFDYPAEDRAIPT